MNIKFECIPPTIQRTAHTHTHTQTENVVYCCTGFEFRVSGLKLTASTQSMQIDSAKTILR